MGLALVDANIGYGDRSVAFHIGLAVPAGTCVGLVGPNGAGKTSIGRALAGLIPLRAGQILLDGSDISKRGVAQRTRLGIVLVPEGRQTFLRLTVEEQLELAARAILSGRRQHELPTVVDGVYALLPELRELHGREGAMLSGGEQQSLAVGRALAMQARWLIVDEPTLGLAPGRKVAVYNTIANLRLSGIGILLIEEAAMMAAKVADYLYVMRDGTIIEHGPTSELASAERMGSAYFGLEIHRDHQD